ncbi:MAG: DNA topoisomerase 3 [Bacteroidales bacterium]|nr:DNA topoisomerase 3 [Bacteroidales bacterium]
MIVCITEKPSVAADIARILGAGRRCDGFWEGNGYRITWTYGHLCCLKEPADYTDRWKHWSLGVLPMIPPRFGIKVIDEEYIRKQFDVIARLIADADEVVNCGDAGQEGELIQRWVMQKADIHCPVKRLWISSMTDQAIRDGFAALVPQEKYDNLYYAGLSRAVGDWILGMNATRLYSLKYSEPGRVLSVGRVQTPTLAMIVRRQSEIDNFVPKDYWELHTVYRETDFMASGKYDDEQAAATIADSLRALPFTVTDVTEKQGREAPPRLFDLTSLQVECNRRWGWSADESLRLIQSLYEKKVTTYPRVDTTYLPDDVYPKVPDILRRMTPYADRTAPVLAARIPKSKKVFDNSKVTDHHAIIPTGESPARLIGDERQLYHLIALRFIAAFYPDCRFMTTTVTGRAGETDFKTSGKVITDPGWRALYPTQAASAADAAPDGDGSDAQAILPPFVKGESGPHEPHTVKKTTQPPKYYTEGTLLRAMETAGRTVDDETLREALKENGIGRPSTRAAIIETLFRRGYISRRRKSIIATRAGIDLIGTIQEELLKSASLTGLWENKLRRIERGDYSAGEFIAELKTLINEIVLAVLRDNSARRIITTPIEETKGKSSKDPGKTDDKPAKAAKPRAQRKKSTPVTDISQIKCPACGKGHLLKGRSAYGCSCYADGCDMRLPFDQYPADLTPADLAKRIKKLSK